MDGNELICSHLELVPPIVRRLRSRLPATILTEDLIATGTLGLVLAARSFVPGKSPFSYWARRKIRETILSSVLEPQRAAEGGGHTRELRHEYTDVPLCDRIARQAFAPEPAAGNPHLALARRHLSNDQRRLVALVYDQGLSLHAVSRGGVLKTGWRGTQELHRRATTRLRQEMERRRAA